MAKKKDADLSQPLMPEKQESIRSYTIVGLILLTVLTMMQLFRILSYDYIAPPTAAAGGFHRQFLEQVSNNSISDFLKEITEKPHVAGSPENFATAEYVHSIFQKAGISAHYADYDVLLSYPLRRSLLVHLPNGSSLELSLHEEAVDGDSYTSSSDIIPTFLAYSPSGNVSAEVVYANYGQKEDFSKLKELGVDVKGSIVIARLGKSFRGDIVANAEAEDAVAVLLYPDPEQYAANGTQGYYPDSKWLPPSGVQRGSIYLRMGDPLTPGWPSTKGAERLDISDALLPKIPALPISAQDALPIMQALQGPAAPPGWSGGLGIGQYHLGKSLAKLQLSYLANETVTGIRNVIGIIPGKERDRYVILGNHRDAWTFGAADPSSGTACLLEIARLFGKLAQSGWKPKRTVVLCSWDAEEYGLIGSTEWVEANLQILSSVDVSVHGPGLITHATPQLDDILFEIASMVGDPDSKGTVFDSWCKNTTDCVKRLGGGGSDHGPFLQHAGIPSFDMTYGDKYPTYHSAYDNYHWMEHFGDPLFRRHVAVCRMWGLLALRLADDRILPFNYVAYANALEKSTRRMEENALRVQASQNISFEPIYSAINQLRQSAQSVNKKSAKDPRIVNDQLLLAERAFLDPDGLPGSKSWYKHLVYGPSETDVYGGEAFPAVVDTIAKLQTQDSHKAMKLVQHEIWRAARAILRASDVLRGTLI